MKVKLFRLFSHCALKRQGFSAILCSDRRENIIMTHLRNVRKRGATLIFFCTVYNLLLCISQFCDFPMEEQKSSALFLVHLSSAPEGRTALLYLSQARQEEEDNANIAAAAATKCLHSYNHCLRVSLDQRRVVPRTFIVCNLFFLPTFCTRSTASLSS